MKVLLKTYFTTNIKTSNTYSYQNVINILISNMFNYLRIARRCTGGSERVLDERAEAGQGGAAEIRASRLYSARGGHLYLRR